MDPRIVRTNRERGDIKRPARECAKDIGVGAIARQQHSMAAVIEYVAVEAIIDAEGRPALAPMACGHRSDHQSFHGGGFAPFEFAQVAEAERTNQCRAFRARDHGRGFRQGLERRDIEMIHVSVSHEDNVYRAEFGRRQRRRDMATRPDRKNRIEREANPIEQRRVTDHAHAEVVYRQRRMAEIRDR